MKSKIIISIVIGILSLGATLIFLVSTNNKKSKQLDVVSENSMSDTLPRDTTPLNKHSIPNIINQPDTTIHCRLSKKDHLIEYYFSGDKIFTTNSTPNDSSIPTSYALRLKTEVYRWDSNSSQGDSFVIPTSEEIKQNPSLVEYQKLVPNKYILNPENITEMENRGYNYECEIVKEDPSRFEPPSIIFTKLLPQANEPNITQ